MSKRALPLRHCEIPTFSVLFRRFPVAPLPSFFHPRFSLPFQWTPLHRCARKGHTDACKFLLQHGADVTLKTMELWTPLHCACVGGHPAVRRDRVRDSSAVVVSAAAAASLAYAIDEKKVGAGGCRNVALFPGRAFRFFSHYHMLPISHPPSSRIGAFMTH